jgi:dolichol-phosphate mannosyltransferase
MRIALAMPCYNEADGITEFLDDIIHNLDAYLDFIVIVNDCSTDATMEIIRSYAELVPKVKCFSNKVNLGHGPTFVAAVKYALSFDPEVLITVDGDGQFNSSEIKEQLIGFKNLNVDVLEGVRTHRTDPFFRKIVTNLLRVLVWSKVHILPLDTNTPLRIYRTPVLKSLLEQIPQQSLIPNLRISALTRRNRLNYIQQTVRSQPRRGLSASGSTWKAKREWIPSKRFLQFCKNALVELWRYPI